MKITSGADREVYPCLSRIVDRRFIFEEAEKEKFVQFLREYEQFCGVQVLTYCLMSNHFHILVEVPKRPETLPPAEEVLHRLKGLSGAAISASRPDKGWRCLPVSGHPGRSQHICQNPPDSPTDMFFRASSHHYQINLSAVTGRWREIDFMQERAAGHGDLGAHIKKV